MVCTIIQNMVLFICGSQVQLDVSRENYLTVINVFNQIEAAKAYLFANSEFSDSSWDTKIARDIFWEQSMHGILQENAGVNSKDFQTEDDFLHISIDQHFLLPNVKVNPTISIR